MMRRRSSAFRLRARLAEAIGGRGAESALPTSRPVRSRVLVVGSPAAQGASIEEEQPIEPRDGAVHMSTQTSRPVRAFEPGVFAREQTDHAGFGSQI